MQNVGNKRTAFCNTYVKYLYSIHEKWSAENREWIEEMEMKFERLALLKNLDPQNAYAKV